MRESSVMRLSFQSSSTGEDGRPAPFLKPHKLAWAQSLEREAALVGFIVKSVTPDDRSNTIAVEIYPHKDVTTGHNISQRQITAKLQRLPYALGSGQKFTGPSTAVN